MAKRVRSAADLKKPGADANVKASRRAVRYRAVRVEGEVYLHPLSALHRSAPEYLVYTQVVQTEKRAYLSGGAPGLLCACVGFQS